MHMLRGALNTPPPPDTQPFHKGITSGEEKAAISQTSPHYLQYTLYTYVHMYMQLTFYTNYTP